MKSKDEILAALPNYYGTEGYHPWSVMCRNFLLTDGAKFIADSCGAYWLMDAIASHLSGYKMEGFVVARLDVKGSGATLTLDDGDDNVLVSDPMSFTDFPLDSIVLYVIPQDEYWVILLPSEY